MSNFNKDPAYDTGKVFEWATDYYDAAGQRLKTSVIPPELEHTGLLVGEPWARVWHNQAMFNFGQYIRWLSGEYVEEKNGADAPSQVENFEPIGMIKMVDSSRGFTTQNAAAYWGGTWTVQTGVTLGASTVDIFTKTALAVKPTL